MCGTAAAINASNDRQQYDEGEAELVLDATSNDANIAKLQWPTCMKRRQAYSGTLLPAHGTLLGFRLRTSLQKCHLCVRTTVTHVVGLYSKLPLPPIQ